MVAEKTKNSPIPPINTIQTGCASLSLIVVSAVLALSFGMLGYATIYVTYRLFNVSLNISDIFMLMMAGMSFITLLLSTWFVRRLLTTYGLMEAFRQWRKSKRQPNMHHERSRDVAHLTLESQNDADIITNMTHNEQEDQSRGTR